jgi:hypothetical protein
MVRRRDPFVATCCVALLATACSQSGGGRPHTASRPHPSPSPVEASFVLDGTPVAGAVQASVRDHLGVVFRAGPSAATPVFVTIDNVPLGPDSLVWSPDRTSAEVSLGRLTMYRPATVAIAAYAPVVAPAPIQVTLVATEPANTTTGVQPGFQPRTPIEIAVENSGPARPQSGLQGADIVYEYLSEYAITRMTAIYFAGMPAEVGPVRSCRMINPYLGYAYSAMTMCSGVSDGTGGWIVGTTPGSRPVPTVTEGTDPGGYFYRVGFKAAPHNLYTSGDRAGRLRTAAAQPAGAYAVDPPHASAAAGTPADAPSVPLHGVSYAYDAGSAQYLRFDHGTPFVDAVTGQQIHAENVVLLHVPFHDAGWVEDVNGGAHSVWYDMLGSGPAEVYSEGRLVRATWHMGAAGQNYFDNRTPVWFTDESGRVMLLNSGLTWVHVLGNGQDRCPQSPSDCG